MAKKHNNKLLCDPYKCYICGIRSNIEKKTDKKFRSIIEIHHIIEQHIEKNDNPENLISVCSNCHSMIHENIIKLDKWYFSTRGWIFHFWDNKGKEFWGN